jgi:hypothetical protein
VNTDALREKALEVVRREPDVEIEQEAQLCLDKERTPPITV